MPDVEGDHGYTLGTQLVGIGMATVRRTLQAFRIA